MLVRVARQHHKKIAIGAPVLFLLVVGNIGVLSGNSFVLRPGSVFVEEGTIVAVDVGFRADRDVNAIGGTILYSPNALAVDSISRASSVLDLWTEQPIYSNTDGTLRFSGGVFQREDTFPREGNVLTVEFLAKEPGKTQIDIKDGELLAADGTGENVRRGNAETVIYVRAKETPSPDVNGDGKLGLADVNSTYLATYRNYDRRYDQNGDGSVSWQDVRAIIALL